MERIQHPNLSEMINLKARRQLYSTTAVLIEQYSHHYCFVIYPLLIALNKQTGGDREKANQHKAKARLGNYTQHNSLAKRYSLKLKLLFLLHHCIL